MAFHLKDNWFFERLPDGGVRIHHHTTPSLPDISLDIDGDGWASIIATVSAQGETAESFKAAKDFHSR